MIDFALYTSTGRLMTNVRAQRVEFSTNRRGPAAASAFFPLPQDAAFRIYNHTGLLFAVVTDSVGTVWRGRVENVAIQRGGVAVRAFGLQRAFSDGLYTALWSRTTTAGWREVTDNDLAGSSPQLYEMDNNNRLYIAPRIGESYANAADMGGWTYAIPHNSDADIAQVVFTYSATLPADWEFELVATTNAFASAFADWSLTGTGSNQTGTVTETLTTPAERVIFRIYNLTGGTSTPSGDTGDWFVKITAVRIKTTTDTKVVAAAIAAALVAEADTAQIIGSRITATENDLLDELYEDERPADILESLALRGGLVWGVDNDGVFYLHPRDEVGNTWYVDATGIELERDLDAVYNDVYATYNDANNRKLRTAAASDDLSKLIYGVTRQRMVNVSTTSATQAAAHRDALLADSAFYVVRARVDFDAVYHADGRRGELHQVRAGDRVVIRNLSPILATDSDELSSFVIDYTRYDVDSNVLEIEPAVPVPTLVTLLANR